MRAAVEGETVWPLPLLMTVPFPSPPGQWSPLLWSAKGRGLQAGRAAVSDGGDDVVPQE